MRWLWLRAILLGVILGPAPSSAAEPADDEPAEVERPQADRWNGQSLRGPHFYVWGETSREAEEWAHELLAAEGDGSGAIEWDRWRRVAEESAPRPPILTGERAPQLAPWTEASAVDAGISPLGSLLCLLPSLDRTWLVSSWATSPDEATRRALARALAAPFEAVGVRGAIDLLERDPSPEVRRLAQAAASRRDGAPA